MEEDIDELLEEVENKFIHKNYEERPIKLLTASLVSSQSSFRCDSLDCDDILRDVEDNADSKPVVTTNLRCDNKIGNAKLRCFPVYLGGSDSTSGCSAIGTPRSCSNLHCISCDFAVYTFDNFQWLSDTDYLFLRTNMPEFERVRDHLLPSEGCRAYACQCCHYSTSVTKQAASVPALSWVCRSHSSQSAGSL
ncbi:protein C8orf37 homolog [Zootermopsis nevadensis]|uniref:Cilia- and flagella-associated protein 418 n=1 Tax=Zootermopsis nevadensis TaxID=136037 RepID=A0A067R100_ZOONE|nr:protein C8orf37 homolog [Zootermopsis nevadensis]KDR15583.1 hypothetical protein L798_10528 [Zootermopsis nevadensis]